jgi:hypothetical protein
MNDYGDNNRDRGYDDYNQQDDDSRDRLIEAARRRVRLPGLLLQLYGAFWVALGITYGGASVASPDGMINAYYDWVENIQKDQPPAQRQQLPPREESIKTQKIQGPIYGVVGLIAGIFMFVGGSKMKELRGFGWSIAGSVLSIFPGMCCCCVGLLPGIWAGVVLLNSDVKLAFTKVARGA